MGELDFSKRIRDAVRENSPILTLLEIANDLEVFESQVDPRLHFTDTPKQPPMCKNCMCVNGGHSKLCNDITNGRS